MIIRILGSAAGGGFPQLNCSCDNCRSVREEKPGFRARTQTSVAASADGDSWVLLNASPDLREQVAATPELWPRLENGVRSSPIEAVVLTNSDVDSVAGLLSLREAFVFRLFASERVLETLAANSIFDVLAPSFVRRIPLSDKPMFRMASGLEIESFGVPGKKPLYAEDNASDFGMREGDTIGVRISDPTTGAAFCYIPCCAAVDQALASRVRGAQLALFDGTLYSDDEMIAQGLSRKTGRRMGHISMSGATGAIAELADLGIKRRVFIHMNNSNPVLNESSAERMGVESSGWEIAFDGMEIRL